MCESSDKARSSAVETCDDLDEVRALAETVLEAASFAGLGVTVSFDGGSAPRYIYINEAAAQILGVGAERLIGSEMLISFAPEEQERLQALAARWRRGEVAPTLAETTVLKSDGERVPVEAAFCAVTLSGEPAIVMFVRGIGDRKASEAALRRSERQFRQLIEAAPDAIGVYRDNRLRYGNAALVALYGRSHEQLVHSGVAQLVHADDREAVARHYEEVEQGTFPSPPIEYRILRADGRTAHVETSSIVVEYEGRPAVLSFTRDTTDRKLLQAHLALRDRMATLGMLAAGVAHEINNPLGYAALNVEAIIKQLESAAPADVSASLRPAVTAARDGLARVASIVRDLKDLSAPQSVERWPVHVGDVLDSAVNVALHAIRDKARIERHYAEVPPIRTDPTKLGQILLNLVFNAAQAFETYDERNVISLRIDCPAAQEVRVSVSDNGPGISREQLDRIFEPFFTTKSQGLGLGLAICQTLATSLDAKLGVESMLGKGTTFVLQLLARA